MNHILNNLINVVSIIKKQKLLLQEATIELKYIKTSR